MPGTGLHRGWCDYVAVAEHAWYRPAPDGDPRACDLVVFVEILAQTRRPGGR
jgi:hypothetical protein